jgi:hypothetical protein
MLPYIEIGLMVLSAAVMTSAIYELSNAYLAAGMTATAEAIRSHSNQIERALRRAARTLKETIKKLLKQKPYFVFEKLTPNIYKFTVSCLTWNPTWYSLTWHANPAQTLRNRTWIKSTYGYLRRPGYTIDEFPYATTKEGGPPLARGCPVPWLENCAQGGYLRAYYYGILRKPNTKFLVIPVPK